MDRARAERALALLAEIKQTEDFLAFLRRPLKDGHVKCLQTWQKDERPRYGFSVYDSSEKTSEWMEADGDLAADLDRFITARLGRLHAELEAL